MAFRNEADGFSAADFHALFDEQPIQEMPTFENVPDDAMTRAVGFLDSKSRVSFWRTAKAVQRLDPELSQINKLLPELGKLIKAEAQEIDRGKECWAKLPNPIGPAISIMGLLVGLGFTAKWVHDASACGGQDASPQCSGSNGGPMFLVIICVAILGCLYPLLCRTRNHNGIDAAILGPVDITKSDRKIINSSQQAKECFAKFKKLFPDSLLSDQATLSEFFSGINRERERLIALVSAPQVAEHVVEIKRAP